RGRHNLDATEPDAPGRLVLYRFLGTTDQLDRREIGALHRVAPADRSVFLEEDGARLGMRRESLGHLPGDGESGTQVGERDDLVAVDLLQHVRAPVVVR